LYDIHWGTVGIYANYGADNQRLLTELKPDEFFGEMGLLSHLPRSATAVALQDNTQVQLISEEVFSEYLKERPAKVLMIMMQLSSRIRTLTKDYLAVCRMAETAAAVEDEQGEWTDYWTEEIIHEYCMSNYRDYFYNSFYWG
jgi:CRP-like cAMP-binding protein